MRPDRSMDIVTGVLPSLIPKLADLVAGEYNLRQGLKGEIIWLQAELESVRGALVDISKVPADQLDNSSKTWSKDMRDLSYSLESIIDRFMVRCKRDETAKHHGFKDVINSSLDWLMLPMIRHKFAAKIRDIKSRIGEVHKRHHIHKVDRDVYKNVAIDAHVLAMFEKQENELLVGIDSARDELIKIMMEGNEAEMQQGKIVSIVGTGGLGKTTLAKVVYDKLRAQFSCSAFVSVSRTPNLEGLFNDLLFKFGKTINNQVLDDLQPINLLREFLQNKRYLIVIDDIWSVSCWDIIRCALPDNKHGYRIITTTRSLDVANKVGGPYKMRSLSQGDSRKLLSNIISGSKYKDNNEDTQKYPDELFEVSHKFLEKCDGVPLAIITIASLLASEQRNKMEWYEVYNSFGTGLDNNTDLNKMRTFFLLSYHNIPSHLRTCLLYLDVFPKDYEIDKARLIWMWIAEGFIQCEEQGRSLFEIGERYFDELLNRHMIQPVYSYGMIEHCRVHDMVFDIIHSLSSEENFVTVLSDEYLTSGVQRLSLQTSKEDHTIIQATRSIMEQVRSAIVFPSAADRMPALGSLRDLCVLDLNDCDLSRGYSLKYLGSLFFLWYLGLSNTRIAQLPEEVGNLQVLQTLSVTCNKIGSLPLTVVRLRNLMCLRIDMDTRVPNGIASLTSLVELSRIGIYDSTDIEMLCYLQELRVLDISCHIECMDNLEKSLVDCLSKLKKVQNLSIWIASGECKLDALVVPQHLCRLSLHSCWLSTLPAWVNPSSLMNLSFISIAVTELKEEDLESLGRLPALCSLNLKVDHENHLGIMRRFFIGAGLFQCLLSCVLWGFRGPVIYRQGAMPRLTSLRFTLHVRDMREIPGSSDAGYNLGLENLLVLQDVTVLLRCGGASDEEVEEVKVALRHATKIHPNHPTIKLIGYEDKDE